MTLRQVTKMGNPVLRQVATEIQVQEITSNEIQELIKDLTVTMHHHKGLGIAAPQIGVSKQVCLVQIPQYNERYGKLQPVPFTVVINPKIQILNQETQGFWEGCLSIPGIRGYVRRPKHIKVSFYNQKAEHVELELKNMGAVTYQHEVDHLFGVLFVDRIEAKKITFISEFQKFELYKTEPILD